MDIKDKTAEKTDMMPAHRSSLSHKIWAGGHGFMALACIALYFLLTTKVLGLPAHSTRLLERIMLPAAFGFLVLMAEKLLESVITKKEHSKASTYNAIRVLKLLSVVVIIGIFVSFLFQNWYTAAASLGLISLILGFALQTPISSFIGWLYIILRHPFRVGDRIQNGDFTGDVVEINYLDTTLWEFAGEYLTNDMPSGRLIRFPNSLVFQNEIYNYSWEKFPFIWNEIPFHIAYESDLEYVEKTLQAVAEEILGDETKKRVNKLKELLKETPVDELAIHEYPYVAFRTNANTWLEATISYLVPPKQATTIRNQILKRAVAELLKQPDRVMFPKTNSR